jgi:hypothetical protein
MHLPAVMAWLVADACLEYLVLSLTETAVCEVLPLASVPVTLIVVTACQKASSEMRMMSSSRDSMTRRCAVSFGSMFLAKNVAVAILPR